MDAVTELQGEPQGKLKITAPMSFGVLHIAPIIADFISIYPKVEIDLQLEDQMVDLIEGGFDLAIRIGHLPTSNLVAKRLVTCKSVLCASPEYLARYGEPENLPISLSITALFILIFAAAMNGPFTINSKRSKSSPKAI